MLGLPEYQLVCWRGMFAGQHTAIPLEMHAYLVEHPEDSLVWPDGFLRYRSALSGVTGRDNQDRVVAQCTFEWKACASCRKADREYSDH